MTPARQTLLDTLRCAVRGQPLDPDPALATAAWNELLTLAREQQVLPLLCEAAYCCPSFRALPRETRRAARDQALQLVARQIVQQNEFLTLLLHAQAQGLDPIVIKGAVTRQLYPIPALRPSVDEDLLIPPEQAQAYHAFLLQEGLFADEPDADAASAWELSYHKEKSPTYIELHMYPFPDAEAYVDCNAYFDGAAERAITMQLEDVTLRTLAPTDHLLYLICHAYKHFLHGGIGIRQICDLGLFARQYNEELDFQRILSACRELRIERLTAALFGVAGQYLGLDIPDVFAGSTEDLEPLLEDVFSGGEYGTADIDRLHSSTITLEAVAADRTGRRRVGALHSVFLPVSDLKGRYPYLRKYPWLLPAAWGQRIWDYLFRQKHVDPARSVRIGRQRVALLRRYGVID